MIEPKWQPIETAPKDGTPVLLTDGEDCVVAHRYEERWDWTACGIYSDDGHFVAPGMTHWMPLPELP